MLEKIRVVVHLSFDSARIHRDKMHTLLLSQVTNQVSKTFIIKPGYLLICLQVNREQYLLSSYMDHIHVHYLSVE